MTGISRKNCTAIIVIVADLISNYITFRLTGMTGGRMEKERNNMAGRIYNRFIVIKNSDADKYLTEAEKESLSDIMIAIINGRARDGKTPENTYLVCNTDEPYAEKVMRVILDGEDQKVK